MSVARVRMYNKHPAMQARFAGVVTPSGEALNWTGKINVVEDALLQPLRWKAPRKIFVNSMSDLFHKNVTDETIDRVLAVAALCPQHTLQILTKRSDRLPEYFHEERGFHVRMAYDAMFGREVLANGWHWPLPNVWLGVSVEDQQRADERIPHLLRTPAAVRWLSCEPLLGAVNILKYLRGYGIGSEGVLRLPDNEVCPNWPIDWLVCGGESGPNARPMHPQWARSLRDQCQAAGVPFFFKQWGEWAPSPDGGLPDALPMDNPKYFHYFDDPPCKVWRFGKKLAGRVLDGRTWDEFPALQEAAAAR